MAGTIRPYQRRAAISAAYVDQVGQELALEELLGWIRREARRAFTPCDGGGAVGGLEVRLQVLPAVEKHAAAVRLEDVPVRRSQSDVEIRQLIARFSAEMAIKMYANMGKAHWQDLPPSYLFDRLLQEISELTDAMLFGKDGDIPAECADVANLAMMLSDRVSAWPHYQEEMRR